LKLLARTTRTPELACVPFAGFVGPRRLGRRPRFCSCVFYAKCRTAAKYGASDVFTLPS